MHHSTLLYRACYKKTVLDMPKEYLDYDIHMGMAMVGDLGFVNEVNGCYRLGSTSSLIKVMPEKVFILYTDAIVSVEHIATQSAMAHLLVSVILSSIKLNNVKFLKTWLDKYKSNIGLFVFGKSAVLLFKRVVYFLYKKIFIYNKSLNILYPRGK